MKIAIREITFPKQIQFAVSYFDARTVTRTWGAAGLFINAHFRPARQTPSAWFSPNLSVWRDTNKNEKIRREKSKISHFLLTVPMENSVGFVFWLFSLLDGNTILM
jgi:hypothetical protein